MRLDTPVVVPEESVGGPTTNEHDGEDRDPGEVHRHGGTRPDGVRADVGVVEAKDVLAKAFCGGLEHGCDEGAGDELSFVGEHDGDNEAILVASGVTQYTLDNLGPHPNGAEDFEEGGRSRGGRPSSGTRT
jgi:hypothetical protein